MAETPPSRARFADELKFVGLFALVYVILHSLYFAIPDDVLRDRIYYHGVTTISADIINAMAPSEKVRAVSNQIRSPRAALEIVRGCDGSGVVFLLAAAIIAFSASIGHKLIGIFGAAVLIYVVNLARIIGLYFVVAHRGEWFTPLHTYFIPTLLIIIAVTYFSSWAMWPLRGTAAAGGD